MTGQVRPSVLVGMFRVLRGRPDGLAQFGDTRQAFLSSLAPLIAFPLVGAAMMLFDGGGARTVADLLATICALIAPPAVSFELARLWAREAHWLRFATAFNWCQWLLPLLLMVLLLALRPAIALGLSENAAGGILFVALGCYAFWMHWFLARHGLGLPVGRAALLVVTINFVTMVLVFGPRLLMGHL